MTRTTLNTLFLVVSLILAASVSVWAKEDTPDPARQVIDKAIEAMGGDAYRNVRSANSQGRLFTFSKKGKGFAMYQDWTVYQPIKSRFQIGEGKRQHVEIFNSELNKGWTLDGENDIAEIPPDAVKSFMDEANVDFDVLLHARLDEEGMSKFYYGPNEISGDGNFEAVEFVDRTNNSAVVFFDRDTHLPSKIETHYTDKMGVRHKREQQRYNWHVIEGVNVALNQETYVDDELSSQLFIQQITFNPDLAPSLFEKPVPVKKK